MRIIYILKLHLQNSFIRIIRILMNVKKHSSFYRKGLINFEPSICRFKPHIEGVQ